jgi:hypothetical protein
MNNMIYTEEELRYMELSRKEDEGTLTAEERSDLDFLERQAEWEMYEDLKYQW